MEDKARLEKTDTWIKYKAYLKWLIWFSNREESLSFISSNLSFSSIETVPIPSGLKKNENPQFVLTDYLP